MTKKKQQSNIQLHNKRIARGKRSKATEGETVFLRSKGKPNKKRCAPVPSAAETDKTKNQPNGISSKVHLETQSYVDKLLCMFDLNYDFGPCVGLTRLERWERASILGLDPPVEIKSLLADPSVQQECLFNKMGI